MFTGIVEEVGTIENVRNAEQSAVLNINASLILEDLRIGDSVAVNGVCLTVTEFDSKGFKADVMHETLNRSGFKHLKSKTKVNLERAMPANGRFGGHIVSGHIDGTGTVSRIEKDDNAYWYTINTDKSIMRYIVEKGSVAIDGISLTVALVGDSGFSISAIPHTVSSTVLSNRNTGDVVNIEVDIVGKYIEKFQQEKEQTGITEDFLMENGF